MALNKVNAYEALIEELCSLKDESILILTHVKPDGDASGSAMAMAEMLAERGCSPVIYLDDNYEGSVEYFQNKDFLVDQLVSSYDVIICLDCAIDDRLGLPKGTTLQDIEAVKVINIDHHVSNPEYGTTNLIDDQSSATCEMLTQLFRLKDVKVNLSCANNLLLGVMTDTGCYKFNNATSETFDCTGWLLEKGAEKSILVEKVYQSTPLKVMQVQSWAISNMVVLENIKLAYIKVTDDVLENYDVRVEDLDSLVDVVREIEGIELVCRLSPDGDNVRFSLRSTNEERPILPLAKLIGGGGHQLACGATMENTSIADAETKFLGYVKEVFGAW